MDSIIGEDHVMSITIEMTSEKTILERHKIKEITSLEVDKEGIIETIVFKGVEVDLGKYSIQVISVEMTGVVEDLDQVQELILTETELDALSVRNLCCIMPFHYKGKI